MKKIDRLRRKAEDTIKKIREITKHIRNVEDNCHILGERLIEQGNIDLGKHLIANGMIHDTSKYTGIEFEYMAPGQKFDEETAKLGFKLAVHQHRLTNPHHPEYWGSIHDMPDVYLAEFCCDVKARSEEFGTDLREWINLSATQKYNFSKDEEIYKKIMGYIDLLCPKPFEEIK